MYYMHTTIHTSITTGILEKRLQLPIPMLENIMGACAAQGWEVGNTFLIYYITYTIYTRMPHIFKHHSHKQLFYMKEKLSLKAVRITSFMQAVIGNMLSTANYSKSKSLHVRE